MLKSFIQYIVGLSAPNIHDIDYQTYSDKPLHRISYAPRADAIEMSTLSSLIDYIKAGFEVWGNDMIIHVQSPTLVSLYSALDGDRNREYIVHAKAQVPSFDFNRFIEHESFCINLQSKCINDPNTDKAILLKFAGTVEAGSVAEYGDDGISQKATVKTGIASKGDALVPSPVKLKMFRTFVEVEQPVSEFIFRMKDEPRCGGITCALFEADGGAWKLEAMDAVRRYLQEHLKGIEGFTIIC